MRKEQPPVDQPLRFRPKEGEEVDEALKFANDPRIASATRDDLEHVLKILEREDRDRQSENRLGMLGQHVACQNEINTIKKRLEEFENPEKK